MVTRISPTVRTSSKTMMENWLNDTSLSLTISIAQCVNLIVQKYTSGRDCVVVAGNTSYFDFPFIRIDYEVNLVSGSYPGKAEFYVVEEDTVENFKLLTRSLGRASTYDFDPRAKFLFVGKNFSSDFLSLISSYYIFNVVFLNAITEEISTFVPFKRKILNVIDVDFRKFGRCTDVSLEKLYLPQLPLVWINSTISIIYRPYNPYAICDDCNERGIEFDVVSIILSHLKIGATYATKPRKLTLEEVFLNYNMLLGSFAAVDANSGHLADYSTSFIDDEALWVTPAPLPLSRWKYFLRIFEDDTLITFGCIVSMATAVWTAAELLFHKGISSEAAFTVPRFVFHVFLGQSFAFRTKSIGCEVLAVFIIFLSYMMNLLFNTRLTYLLNGNNLEDSIDSFEEIVENRLVIGCPQTMKRHFNSSPKMAEYLESYYEDCDVGNKCLMRAAFGRDMAVCKASRRLRYEVSLVDNETGLWLLTEIRPALYSRHTSAFFQRGHPLLVPFDKYLYWLIESGIVRSIIQKYEKVSKYGDPPAAVARKLQVKHIVAPLFLLNVGFVLGAVVFAIELFFKHNHTYRYRRNCY